MLFQVFSHSFRSLLFLKKLKPLAALSIDESVNLFQNSSQRIQVCVSMAIKSVSEIIHNDRPFVLIKNQLSEQRQF